MAMQSVLKTIGVAARLTDQPCYSKVIIASRRLHGSGVCHGQFGSHMSDNDPDVLEAEKERALKGETIDRHPDFPDWNEPLASASEAVVKSEKAKHRPIEDLQKETVEVIKEIHHSEDTKVSTSSTVPKEQD